MDNVCCPTESDFIYAENAFMLGVLIAGEIEMEELKDE